MSPAGWRSLLASALLLAVGLAGTVAAPAQGFDTPPQPGAPRPLTIAIPFEQRLPNGLRVVLAERRGVQLVSAQLVVLSGSEVDPPRQAGLAELTAGMLAKGTRRRSASALAQAAESLGGALESSAGWHQSEIAVTVTVPKLDAALALVGEAIQQPAFATAELARLRAQALDELKVAYSRPATLATLASQRQLFGSGAYGHPSSGTPASLARIDRAALLAYHARHYRPDNAVLVLAGDLDAGSALRLARRHFGAWKASRPAGVPRTAPKGAPLPQTVTVIDMPASGQTAVVVAAPLSPLTSDRATAAVMNAVLGGGYSSRLNQEIRIRRGLSYGATSVLDMRPGGNSLRAVVQTKNASAAEVVRLVQAEFDRLVATPVGAAELAARKASLIGEFSRGVETTAGLGATVKALIIAGRPLAELSQHIEALSSVGADAVQRYAAEHLGAADRRVVIAGDAASFIEALRAAAPGVSVVPAGRLDLDAGMASGAP